MQFCCVVEPLRCDHMSPFSSLIVELCHSSRIASGMQRSGLELVTRESLLADRVHGIALPLPFKPIWSGRPPCTTESIASVAHALHGLTALSCCRIGRYHWSSCTLVIVLRISSLEHERPLSLSALLQPSCKIRYPSSCSWECIAWFVIESTQIVIFVASP